MNNRDLPVAIIGGGPVGLAVAAHLKKSNQPFILFETGRQIGANILKWGHVRLFSPWEYNIDKAAETLLREAHIPIPNKEYVPYGKEIIDDYLKPLANLRGIKEKNRNKIPNNITTIKHCKACDDKDFLSYGSSSKNLYLLLLEDL